MEIGSESDADQTLRASPEIASNWKWIHSNSLMAEKWSVRRAGR